MDNPETLLEKIDAAANYVEQMFLAHMVRDEAKLKEAHQKASDLLFDASRMAEELEDTDDYDGDENDPNDSRNI